jgi:hypothetical protein
MSKPRTTPPTLEEFNSFSQSCQWKYRDRYPGMYPDPIYKRWGRVPTIEEYNRACKQYKHFLRNKFPGVFPAAGPKGRPRKVINNSPTNEKS